MRLVDRRERERAARELDRNLVVTAGAGTGKTSLLIERMLHLLLERGVPLERLAAITFTRKAAAELRDRLEDALERSVLLAAGPAGTTGEEKEADRVLARLDRPGRAEAARRALAALSALDGATLTTLHGFASEILRRHHREAKVDVGFRVDEGDEGARLFDELWGQHLELSLGPRSEAGPWRGLLGKLSLDEVEKVARRLAGFGFPLEVLGEECERVQRAHLELLCAGRLEELRSIRKAVEGARKLNPRVLPCLELLESILAAGPEKGFPAPDLERLQKSCTLGTNVELTDREALDGRLKRLLSGVRDMSGIDLRIASELGGALRPFLLQFREEHLRRGLLSYDGLIVLARDLLRDHPHLRRAEAQRFDQLLVDEFQDTDPLQYEIVLFLAEAPPAVGGRPSSDAFHARLAPGKLFIVGDQKQSIYRFRGADIQAYRRAVEAVRREGGEVLTLRSNFRSVPELVEPLNTLFGSYFTSPREPARDPSRDPGPDPEFAPLAAERDPSGSPSIEIWSAGEPDSSARERRRAEAEAIADWLRLEVDSGRCALRQVAILLYALSDVDLLLRPLRQRGIPYLLEGGKGFYGRLEVELLLAFLRAVLNPADPVALVSCLRSPLGAVPDRELQLFAGAQERGERGGGRMGGRGNVWTLAARPDGGEFPHLSRALGWMRAFEERHRGAGLDLLARAALVETPIGLSMASSYQGAQRVANLEKAVRRISLLSREGSLSGEEVLDRIEEEGASDQAQGDSPLSDESTEAVRILSIHKAKGLEWPVVILPDLARDTRPGGGTDTVAATRAGASGAAPGPAPALALQIGGVKTPALVGYRFQEDMQKAAELKRLLYVAATRARDRLILVAGAVRKGTSTWVEALGYWGYEAGAGFPPAGEFLAGKVIHRRFPGSGRPPFAAAREEPDARLLDGARRFGEARARLDARRPLPILSPSSLRGELPPGDGEPELRLAGEEPRRREARAAGTALHLLLEVWDRKDPSWLLESAGKAVRVAATRAGVDPAPVLARVRGILEEAERSGRLRALQGEEAIARELPLLYRDGAGSLWEGTIDLLSGPLESPTVVDYKTDAAGTPAELEALHAAQLAVYASGVAQALNLPAPPPTRLEKLGTATYFEN